MCFEVSPHPDHVFVKYWLLEESCRFCDLGCLAFGGPRRVSGGHPGGLAAEVRCWLVSLHAFPWCWSQRGRAEPGHSWFLGSVLRVCLAEEGWDAGLAHLFTQVCLPGWLVRLRVPSASSSCHCGCAPGMGCQSGQGKLRDADVHLRQTRVTFGGMTYAMFGKYLQ